MFQGCVMLEAGLVFGTLSFALKLHGVADPTSFCALERRKLQ
jgi:hypothetical protein